jgi:hypothetical protein
MKALSILQPWAWLIVNGHKDIENRKWRTAFRGEILIHAGKGLDLDSLMWLANNFCKLGLSDDLGGKLIAIARNEIRLERGGIVGKATVTDCINTSESRWFNGPWGFVLAEACPVPFVPLRGALGFFEVPWPSRSEPMPPQGQLPL